MTPQDHIDQLFWWYFEKQLFTFFASERNNPSVNETLRTFKTAKEVAVRYSWNEDATLRFLRALGALGYLAEHNGYFKAVEKQLLRLSSSQTRAVNWFAAVPSLSEETSLFTESVPTLETLSRHCGAHSAPDFVKAAAHAQDTDALIGLAYDQFIVARFFTEHVLEATLREGRSQVQRALGLPSQQIFDHYGAHDSFLQLYSASFSFSNSAANAFVAEQVRFQENEFVLDVGGGAGGLCRAILNQQPNLNFAIYDHPNSARSIIAAQNMLRIELPTVRRAYGDFFNDTHGGLHGIDPDDRYAKIFLGWILHDWSDEQCVAILRRCGHHLQPTGTIYILEKVITNTVTNSRAILLDFLMLSMADGQERKLDEYKAICEKADLRIGFCITNPGRGRDIIGVEKG